MTRKEASIITAITQISFGGKHNGAFNQYAEEKFGHPIFTHQMADKEFWDKLKELAMPDFVELAHSIKE